MKKCFVSFAAAGLSLLLITSMALAGNNFLIENNELFIVKGGAKTLLIDSDWFYKYDLSGDRRIYAGGIDPQNNEAHQGLEGGIYFFSPEGKIISFLALEDAEDYLIHFSPDGSRVVLNGGGSEYPRGYTFYEFAGFKELTKCVGWGRGQWLNNNYFIFTLADETQPRPKINPSDDYQPGRLSVAVYDAAKNEFTILKEATDSEDYVFFAINEQTGQGDISRLWSEFVDGRTSYHSAPESIPLLFNK